MNMNTTTHQVSPMPTSAATKPESKSKRVSFLIPRDMAAAIETVCDADGRNPSEVIRDALRLYLRLRVPSFSPIRPGRRQYSGEELSGIAEILQNDPSYARLRDEKS